MSVKGTVLIRFSAGRPQFYKKDKALTAETQDNNKMSGDAGNFNKCLIPTSYLKEWDKGISALRAWFYDLTSPYDDNSGYRICTPDGFWKFNRIYLESQQTLMGVKSKFVDNYEAIIDEQRCRLGDAFHVGDFPQAEAIEAKFRMEIDVAEVPKKGALFHLGEEEEKRLLAKAEERLNASHLGNYQRLLRAVNHLTATLSDEGKLKNCKSTTLTNVQELADVIPDINFKDDPLLNQLADQTRQLLDSVSMSDLKKDDETRQRIAAGATETSQHIESMVALYA